MAGVAKSHTTAYHPMGNGGTERFNRTLGNMLRALPLKEKQQWPQQVQTLTFAYNATVHETTGYAPFFLMFGRVPRLPVDVMFRQVLDDPGVADYDAYAKSLLSCLKSAMEIARNILPLLLEVIFLPLPGFDQNESAHATDRSWAEEESDEEDCVSDDDEMASVSGELTRGENAQDMSDSRDEVELSISSPDDY